MPATVSPLFFRLPRLARAWIAEGLAEGANMSSEWRHVAGEAEFGTGNTLAVERDGWHVLIVCDDGGAYHAVNDRCTHQGAKLSGGKVRRGAIMCPLHGARFEVGSGKCIGGAYRDLRTFPLRIADGAIEVQLPDHPPGIEDQPLP